MGNVADKIQDLKDRKAKILQMGGEKAVAKHKEGGKLTARERLDLFFDKGSFRELDVFVTHRCTNFGMEKVEVPSDGSIGAALANRLATSSREVPSGNGQVRLPKGPLRITADVITRIETPDQE